MVDLVGLCYCGVITFNEDCFLFLGTLGAVDSLMSIGSCSESGFNADFFRRPPCLVTCLN